MEYNDQFSINEFLRIIDVNYGKSIKAILLLTGVPPHDLQDIYHDLILKWHRTLPISIDRASNNIIHPKFLVSSYYVVSAKNFAIDSYRKKKRNRPLNESLFLPDGTPRQISESCHDDIKIPQCLLDKNGNLCKIKLYGMFSPFKADVLFLRMEQKLSYIFIAKKLKVRPRDVKTALEAIRRRLRQIFQEELTES